MEINKLRDDIISGLKYEIKNHDFYGSISAFDNISYYIYALFPNVDRTCTIYRHHDGFTNYIPIINYLMQWLGISSETTIKLFNRQFFPSYKVREKIISLFKLKLEQWLKSIDDIY